MAKSKTTIGDAVFLIVVGVFALVGGFQVLKWGWSSVAHTIKVFQMPATLERYFHETANVIRQLDAEYKKRCDAISQNGGSNFKFAFDRIEALEAEYRKALKDQLAGDAKQDGRLDKLEGKPVGVMTNLIMLDGTPTFTNIHFFNNEVLEFDASNKVWRPAKEAK